MSQATLVAPQDGVIRSRLMETGDMASAARPVYLIGLSDPKWIRAYVPESRLGELREGMEANVYVDSFPNEAIKGKVGYISDTAEFTPNLYRRRSSGHRSFMKCAFLWMMKRIASAWECRQR